MTSQESWAKISASHSIVDHEQLGAYLKQYYKLSSDAYCELIHRGMNDVYKVRDRNRLIACRVWRTAWRSFDDVAYELGFLRHLHERGVSVAYPIATSTGQDSFIVSAPEGPRSVALFHWAEGEKFGDNPDQGVARTAGALFAKMHLAGANYKPPDIRRTNSPTDYADNLPFLKQLVADRPKDYKLYETVAEKLFQSMAELEGVGLPFGPGHGDFHFNNFHVDGNGCITLLDFDNSGEDYLAQDVACYLWANNYGKLNNSYAKSFFDGYNSVREFTEEEKAQFPLFMLAKEFRLISGFAKNVNQIGHFPLRFRNLEWFANSIRTRAMALGFIS